MGWLRYCLGFVVWSRKCVCVCCVAERLVQYAICKSQLRERWRRPTETACDYTFGFVGFALVAICCIVCVSWSEKKCRVIHTHKKKNVASCGFSLRTQPKSDFGKSMMMMIVCVPSCCVRDKEESTAMCMDMCEYRCLNHIIIQQD